jgi:hypothetical protein
MLNRIAASFLSLALLAPTVAGARNFAQPPGDDAPVLERMTQPARLRAPVDRAALIQALAKRRAHNLAAFRAYRKGGVYPHNFVRSGPLNIWIDEEGHLCAAATMIDKDGKHQLVVDTSETNNQIRLLDVTDGPLMDWILTSGLTLEEIDRIQAPMVMPSPRERERLTRGGEWRVAEDARLRRGYAATDAWLVKHERAGLAAAADRLMEHPDLALALIGAVS